MNCNTIILCGGNIDFYSLPVNTNTSNSMIPINGKPVISWILEDLIEKKISEATIVLRELDQHLQEFLERVFIGPENSLSIDLVFVPEGGSIIHSLKAGLDAHDHAIPARVILGDTLILDSFEIDEDLLYVHEVDDSHRWCLAVVDEQMNVTEYLDKEEQVVPPYLAVCGYYHFSDGAWLQQCVDEAMSEGKRQLSDVLSKYGKKRTIRARNAHRWLDFGNIDNLVKAKQELLQSRFFNSLTIDPVLNTITKVSTFDEKLNNELNWYLQLPPELQVLTPRIVSSKQVDGQLNLVQEYYGYPTLSELYLYSDIHPENWIIIIKKLLSLHSEFCKYPKELSRDHYRKMYVEKTFDRLGELRKENEQWEKIFQYETITFNGKELINIPGLWESLKERAEQISENGRAAIIHGDFCFSNILFDINGQIARLIDPRGSFGESGIYGDPRYDLAKLRHSINGLYDYIVSDLFELREEGPIFEARIFLNQTAEYLGQAFDKMISEMGYDAREVIFIEALLFISMLPLHRDKPRRQKMMYLRGLELLNEIFNANSN